MPFCIKSGGLFSPSEVCCFSRSFEAYEDIGAWTFIFGSLLYLVVTVHDLMEVRQNWRHHRHHDRAKLKEYIAAASYVWGTVLFTVGSIFFLSTVGLFRAGAWCFIVGSLLFVLGACINVLQILQANTRVTLQLMNLTAVSYVVGSVLFTVASIPYLWNVSNPTLKTTLYAFLAWQYLTGSVLFLMGGVFNYWRAYIVIRDAAHRRKPARSMGTGG